MAALARPISLRALVVGGLAVAMALVFVPIRRITADVVALATEHAERASIERSAGLAARAVAAGAPTSTLLGEGIACVCEGSSCAGACPTGDPTRALRACAFAGDREVCVAGPRAPIPETALRLGQTLLLLVAVTVFAASTLLLTLFVIRPLRALTAEARRIEEGREALPRTGSFVEEIQGLERSIASMVDRLRAREREVHERLAATETANAALQRSNRELAEARAQLLQAERLAAVGRLSAGLAHEIGNPLTAILSLLDLVIPGDLPEAQQRDFLERIRAENERIGAIVRGLVDFSRPDAALTEATRGVASPVAVVDDLLRFFEPQRRYAHARFGIAGDRIARDVRMHPGALRQVLLNLLLNAADALEAQEAPGVVLVAFEDAGDAVRILVEDDGPGVAVEVGDRLFEPFVTGKADRGGTGLGLAVCRGLVEAAGGKLELERTGPTGTRFAVTLPAVG